MWQSIIKQSCTDPSHPRPTPTWVHVDKRGVRTNGPNWFSSRSQKPRREIEQCQKGPVSDWYTLRELKNRPKFRIRMSFTCHFARSSDEGWEWRYWTGLIPKHWMWYCSVAIVSRYAHWDAARQEKGRGRLRRLCLHRMADMVATWAPEVSGSTFPRALR